MAPSSVTLKVRILQNSLDFTKTLQFRLNSSVSDACTVIRQKVAELQNDEANIHKFGLFMPDAYNPDDERRGLWLDNNKTLDAFGFKNGDLILYKSRARRLQIRTMDGTRKTLEIDDALSIREVMPTICARMGIANHDEYGLIQEQDEQERMATLRKNATLSRDDEKMEKMKRKLHTDDELHWLDASKTLREQAVQEQEVLLLKRRLFYSDQNIDGRDPVQLNLLYVQLKEAIMNGAHPVTLDQAISLAGYQCHIQFGASAEMLRPSSLDLQQFLPAEYCKSKGIDKKILQAQRSCTNLSEIEAKLKYVNFCRSLETYGINFFLVKEKVTSKNKLVPRLFGVSKHSVYSVDQKTKVILKKWPLTSVKRWAATVHGFTLDFGGYSDRAISAKTSEGEAITKLISAYIDLILKKQKHKTFVDTDGEEQQAIIEQCVEQQCVTSVGHVAMPGAKFGSEVSIVLPGTIGSASRPISHGSLVSEPTTIDYSNVTARRDIARVEHIGFRMMELPSAQRALVTSVQENVNVIQMAKNGLDEPDDYAPVGRDNASRRYLEQKSELSRANISSNLTSASVATADLLRTTAMNDGDDAYMIVGSAVHTIASNVEHILSDVKNVIALQEQQQQQFGETGQQPNMDKEALLQAARNLADAFADLLSAAQPVDSREPERDRQEAHRRKKLVEQIDEISGICDFLINALHEDCATDGGHEELREFRERLLTLAEDVAHRAAQLIGRAKTLTHKLDSTEQQEALIGSATLAGVNTQRLVATAKVIAPVAQQPACQAQLLEAAKCVTSSVQQLLVTATDVAPRSEEALVNEIENAVGNVREAVDSLETHIATGPLASVNDSTVREIDHVTAALADSTGDSAAMARYAKQAAVHAAHLVSSLRAQAEVNMDEGQQRRLLEAAKNLADATASMIESAKMCANQPESEERQEQLKDAADSLRMLISEVGGSVMQSRVIKSLQYCAQNCVIAATELVNTAQSGAKKSRASNFQMTQDCKTVADMIPRLILAVRAVRRDPDDAVNQLDLIATATHFLPPCSELVNSSRIMQPTITDAAMQRSLNSSINQLQNAVKELQSALNSSSSLSRHLDLDGALEQLRRLSHDINDLELNLDEDGVVPLPGESLVDATIQLAQCQRSITQEAQAALNFCADGGHDRCGSHAKELANRFKDIVESMRSLLAFAGIDANASRIERDRKVTSDTKAAIAAACDFVATLRKFSNNSSRPANSQDQLTPEAYKQLLTLKSDLIDALTVLSNHVPGAAQVASVTSLIDSKRQKLQANADIGLDRSNSIAIYGNLQSGFTTAAVNLNQATGDLVHSATEGNQHNLAQSTAQFGECYESFVNSGTGLISATDESTARQALSQGLNHVAEKSGNMLLAARSVCYDPSASQAKLNLQGAARLVTESVNNMIALVTCNEESPEQRVCDTVLNRLESALLALQRASRQPVSSDGYYPSLACIIEQTQSLAEAMSEMAQCSVDGNTRAFCEFAQMFGDSVYRAIAYHTAQCLYLVGVADPNSLPGRRALLDADLIGQQLQHIRTVCDAKLQLGEEGKQPRFTMAQLVAKSAGLLVSHCKSARSRSSDQVAKQIVRHAKDIATGTSEVVKIVGDMNSSDDQLRFEAQVEQLCSNVQALHNYASGTECCGQAAQISESGILAQQPLFDSAAELVQSAEQLVKSAAQLTLRRHDSRAYEAYSSSTKHVSDCVKSLLNTIKKVAPGRQAVSNALDAVRNCLQQMENMELNIGTSLGSHSHGTGDSLCLQQMHTTASYVLQLLPSAGEAAAAEPEALAHLVTDISSHLTALKDACISSLQCDQNQHHSLPVVFDNTKTVLEAADNFLEGCYKAGGNPDAVAIHQGVKESQQNMEEVCRELLESLETVSAETGDLQKLAQSLDSQVELVIAPIESSISKDSSSSQLVESQTQLARICSQLKRTHEDLCSQQEAVADTVALLQEMASHYATLVPHCKIAVSACGNRSFGDRMTDAAAAIGRDCAESVRLCQRLQPGAQFSQSLHSQFHPSLLDHITQLLTPLQSLNRGTEACIAAASSVAGIVSELDTTVLYALAGTLTPLDAAPFTDHRESILRTARVLVDEIRQLAAGPTSSQQELVDSAHNAAETIDRLAKAVKAGAATLGNDQKDAQVMLVNAARDVASAMSDLICATKFAAGCEPTDSFVTELNDSAKSLIGNVASLVKTVNTVKDESCRGSRALESSIDAVNQQLRQYESSDLPEDDGAPSVQELDALRNPIINATSKIMQAANSGKQQDVLAAGNASRKALVDLLHRTKLFCAFNSPASSKQSSSGQPSSFIELLNEQNYKLYMTARDLCHCNLNLMEQLLKVSTDPSAATKPVMSAQSKQVADALQEFGSILQRVNDQPPEESQNSAKRAESEVANAVSQVEAAAKRLDQIKYNPTDIEADDQANQQSIGPSANHQPIIDSTKGIAEAIRRLLIYARLAQSELAVKSPAAAASADNDGDGPWSQSFVTAAKQVAAAVHHLCETTDAVTLRRSSEDRLISVSKQVAASTAQLLVASRVHADPHSQTTRNLQEAGQAVKRETERLVAEAQAAVNKTEEDSRSYVGDSMVQSVKSLIEVRESILQKQRQLEEEQRRFQAMMNQHQTRFPGRFDE